MILDDCDTIEYDYDGGMIMCQFSILWYDFRHDRRTKKKINEIQYNLLALDSTTNINNVLC